MMTSAAVRFSPRMSKLEPKSAAMRLREQNPSTALVAIGIFRNET